MKPKYIDLQVNGHGGIDLLSAKSEDEVRVVSRSLYKNDVAGYLPTIITSSLDSALSAINLIEQVRKDPKTGEALILGIHLEGPFISRERAGIHPKEFIKQPNLDHLKTLLAAGKVKQVTLAPEITGAIDLIKYLVDQNILVSLGHSNATKAQAIKAFEAGAKTVTHLFNAMPKPPEEGLSAAAIERADVVIQIIVDGVHVSDQLLSQTLPKIKDRFIITNDSVAAAGFGDGNFSFGDINLVAKDGQARSVEGKLAGGIANMADSIKRLTSLGISNEIAVASATTRPCDLIGVSYESVINHFN